MMRTGLNIRVLLSTLLISLGALGDLKVYALSARQLADNKISKKQFDGNIEVWWSSELLPDSHSPVWYTNPPDPSEIRYKLDRQTELKWKKSVKPAGPVIRVNPDKTYQTVLGIGTSLEATTLYAIKKNRSEEEVREILKLLIDPDHGMGFNLFRITIGTSDFSDGRTVSTHPKGFYSYQDNSEAEFSIQPDIDLGIVDMLKLTADVAANLDPPQEIKFTAACWSPPGWMKTSGTLIGGTLKSGYEKHLAGYFRKFIEAYAAEGIPIYAITIQNEPNYLPKDYPGMMLTPEQEMAVVVAAYENFHSNLSDKDELQTKIWINDHNFEDWVNADYILTALEKMGKKHYVDATAFHNYTPFPASNMSKLHQKHPHTDIQLTEHSEWGVAGMRNIQQYFQNWSRSYMYWVTMTTKKLDEHNQGPYNRLGELSPTLLIEKNSFSPEWYVTPEYYLISQFSKFIRPGAIRINCDKGSDANVTFVAFKNLDNSIVLVGVNQTKKSRTFTVKYNEKMFSASLAAKCMGTYRWQE
ncbi:MAG: glycosyl hydrolase [Candidatus Marinimicrobia bacterium]|nr:glycosyl hydrolase [Candidatus Neomarinimicrobiota bacterium]